MLHHALVVAGVLALAAAQAQDAAPRQGAIRVGCGMLADSQGRAVSQQAGAESQIRRPSYCPDVKTAPVPEPAPAAAAATPESDAKPVQAEAPAPRPAQSRPGTRPVARPAPRPAAPAPVATAKPVSNLPRNLESSRTTHAFGEPPELRLDPGGAGLALVASGGLLWFLRSGFAVSLLLLGLPVWRDVDLLPVVAGAPPGSGGGADDAADGDDDADSGALLTAGIGASSLPAGTA